MKKFKPATPGLRGMQLDQRDKVSKDDPEKSLILPHYCKAGRNNMGRITVRHKGSGVKRKYRKVDFLGEVVQKKGIIEKIEYDPNRSAWLSLVKWETGVRTYSLYCNGLSEGDTVENGKGVEIKNGNRLALADMPTGIKIHNIELTAKKGGQLVRAAGAYAILMAKNNNYATIKLPSGENRLINLACLATVGEVGNLEHGNRKLGKAGRSRHLGIRPTVRGSVMNPCDHPHGGGEGKCPIGHAGPLSPTGVPALGFKTRKRKKPSTKWIIKRRK